MWFVSLYFSNNQSLYIIKWRRRYDLCHNNVNLQIRDKTTVVRIFIELIPGHFCICRVHFSCKKNVAMGPIFLLFILFSLFKRKKWYLFLTAPILEKKFYLLRKNCRPFSNSFFKLPYYEVWHCLWIILSYLFLGIIPLNYKDFSDLKQDLTDSETHQLVFKKS